jgi:hypothetical protein|tara:strand:+ start:1629 stop:1850 length:222 start_codon:yes stop_codon:yes gene_type:complete
METNLGSKIYKQFDDMLKDKPEEAEEKMGGLLARTMPKKSKMGMGTKNDVNKRVSEYMMQIRQRRESFKNGRS